MNTHLQTDSPKPLYEQIKEYILHHIYTGEFSPNTRIPSERNLAQQFGVSRLTVSKAIQELVQAGWLYVQIGKGTYISDSPIDQEIEALTSFTEDMAIRGKSTYSDVLASEIRLPEPQTAEVLRIPNGVNIVHLVRVRYAGERPMALEQSSVIAALCPDILQRFDFSSESLYRVLRTHYDIHLTHAEQTFEARAASDHEAEHLLVEAGSPVLAIHRITYNQDDAPVEEVKSVYRGDRYKFRALLRRL